jgi:purine-cytosine permease-like protein
MPMPIPIVLVSMLLFIVLFFGIGFLLNMLLRATWVMAIIYPVIVILIVDNVKFYQYITEPNATFPMLKEALFGLKSADIVILLSGLFGAFLSGIAIKMLRTRGYQMF